ncbi:MAG: alpha-L-arabinofuranosidase C-terminal domain-containing protein [Fimbriimonas sp.]
MSLTLMLASLLLSVDAQVTVHMDRPTVRPNSSMYGIFFEEINQAGEGGVYAELLRNRGMEGGEPGKLPVGWNWAVYASGSGGRATGKSGGVFVDREVRLNASRSQSLRIDQNSDSGNIILQNQGFWGIPLIRGASYKLTLWMKGDTGLSAKVGTESSTVYTNTFDAPGDDWKRFEATFRSSETSPKGNLTLSTTKPGKLWIGYASLIPLDTRGGLRKDLAQHIGAIKPGFVRFPGGCFVEGDMLPIAWNWKDTLGPVEARKGMARSQWGYPISNGLGFHEYLQWCEDMKAEPMFVVNVGMSHGEVAPMAKMDRYLQDALDAIEYANGPVTSKWGALRASNGHPTPFNLKYIEIGNENGGPAYNERFGLFSKAIHAKYPEIVRIADLWGGGLPTSAPYELIDEHYYSTPSWFWSNAKRYDSYSRSGPKIYVGEYAVTNGSGRGNLAAALGEAAFMTGMERNADVVRLASYAPLLENVNNRQWNPNAIPFDSQRSYGTPSYWVQQLFGSNLPSQIVQHKVTAPVGEAPAVQGLAGLVTWRTAAEFRDVELKVDGQTIYTSAGIRQEDLQSPMGKWSVADGVISQTGLEENRRALLREASVRPNQSVSLSLKAKKLSGAEGFIILLGSGERGTFQWNLGGWNNTVHAFQRDDERVGKGVSGSIETGRWYDIRLERDGARTRGYLDGKLVEELVEEGRPDFVAVAGIDTARKELIVKVVNGASTARMATLNLTGRKLSTEGTVTILSGTSLSEENSFEAPKRIAPKVSKLSKVSDRMSHRFPALSLSILRIPLR